MRRLLAGPVGFVLYHLFFAAALLAISIFGLTLIRYVFLAIGGVIVIIGFFATFVGLEFITGIYDQYGNEYYATNFKYKLILGFSIFLIGAAVAGIPEMVDVPEWLAAIISTFIVWVVGIKMMGENVNWGRYDLNNTTLLLGKLVPIMYMTSACLFIVSIAFSWSPVILIVFASICTAAHLTRMVLVLKDNPF